MLTPAGIQGPTGSGTRLDDLRRLHQQGARPYRGYGQHASAYLIERVMDRIASALSMDPVEVRRRNLIPTHAFPYQTPLGTRYDSGDYEAALDRALALADYGRLREEQRRLRERGGPMGIGSPPPWTPPVWPLQRPERPGYETATVRVDASGKVTVLTGSSPHGQGWRRPSPRLWPTSWACPLTTWRWSTATPLVPQGPAPVPAAPWWWAAPPSSRPVNRCGRRRGWWPGHCSRATRSMSPEGGRFVVADVPDRSVTWPDVGRAVYGPTPCPAAWSAG